MSRLASSTSSESSEAAPVIARGKISRSIIYHKAFVNSIHIDEHLFIFGQAQADGASHESAIARSIAITDDETHSIGCKIAAQQNARIQPKFGDSPIPPDKRRYYCDFRSGESEDMTLLGDGYRITLTIDGLTDEPSHVDVALFIDTTDKNARNTIKTDAGLELAQAFGAAIEFICPTDTDNENHPLNKNPQCLQEGLPRFSTAKNEDGFELALGISGQ